MPVPVIATMGEVLDGQDGGTAPGQTEATVLERWHPLAAGLSATVTVSAAAEEFHWGTPGESAVTVASVAGSSSQAVIFAYEKGVAMHGSVAPARRLAFTLCCGDSFTGEAWRLFDAAVAWATDSTAVVWDDVTGATVSDGVVTKTAGTQAWDAGATSGDYLLTGDGYLGFTVTETDKERLVGLTRRYRALDPAEVDYAFHLGADGILSILERGVTAGSFGPYQTGDRLTLTIEAGVVVYRRNGALLYTSSATPTYPLWAVVLLRDPGASVAQVNVSGLAPGRLEPDSGVTGHTPPGLAPGAPAGSFPLSGFESVNLYSGSLHFALPLLSVGGRGDVRVPLVLPIEQHWRVEVIPVPGQPDHALLNPVFNWWEVTSGYGPGILLGRTDSQPVEGGEGFITLRRLTYHAPDNTETQLRDTKTDGHPEVTPNPFPPHFPNRGTTFVSNDGSAMTFESDQPVFDFGADLTGYLAFRDGVKFRVEGNLLAWAEDRNGNRTEFEYGEAPPYPFPRQHSRPTAITDSLGRRVTIRYATDASPEDVIAYSGAGGASRTIRVRYGNLEAALAPGQGLRTLQELFPLDPGLSWILPERIHNPRVATAAVLPDGREYVFRYNSYAELASVGLPSEGRIEYRWEHGNATFPTTIPRRVRERRVDADGDGAPDEVTLFSDELPGEAGSIVEQRRVEPGSGGTIVRERHHFYGSASGNLAYPPLNYPTWRTAKEFRTEVLDGSGQVLRRMDRAWVQRAGVPWVSDQENAPEKDPRIVRTTTRLENGLVSEQLFAYDRYNNPTLVEEYDFGDGGPGPLARSTSTSYVTENNGYDYDRLHYIHLRSLPSARSVRDGQGREKARTTYEYDKEALTNRSNVIGRGLLYGPGWTPRGNLTAVNRRLVGENRTSTTRHEYDILGNVVKTVDPRGNASRFFYEDRFGAPDGTAEGNDPPGELGGLRTFAFQTGAENALGHRTSAQYDYHLGRSVDESDPNGVVTSSEYEDALDRPTEVVLAANRGIRSRTRFVYLDQDRTIRTVADLDSFGDGTLRTETAYDGLGRTVRSRQREGGSQIVTETAYDARGLVSAVSNPYRPSEGGPEYTSTEYDALGRAVSVATPDGATVHTAYEGNETVVEDPAGKKRKSVTDALGRVTRVVEDPDGQALETRYEYDALDNLTKVVQGEQTREFTYDGLSRLRTAQNPESGTTTYEYDLSGNLIEKKDSRGVSTFAGYDALDRVKRRSYSDGTPAVSYVYDEGPDHAKGRLVRASSSASASEVGAYDALGRVTEYSQSHFGRVYPMSYAYNRAGLPIRATYASGRVVETSYDGAGRVSGLRATFAGEQADFIVDGTVDYAPHGGLRAAGLGNGLSETAAFNERLQLRRAEVGPGLLRLQYGYGGTDNNGNVSSQTITAGPRSFGQSYQYDALNRLSHAVESGGWTQDYGLDRYGNRWVLPGSYMPLPAQTPQSAAAFSTASNRIVIPGTGYDPAGNLTTDWVGRSFQYDAEGRQVVFAVPGRTTVYQYDGDGRRVTKVDSGQVSIFIYDAFGRLATEVASPESRDYVYAGDRLLAAVRFTGDIGGAGGPCNHDLRCDEAFIDGLNFGENCATCPSDCGCPEGIDCVIVAEIACPQPPCPVAATCGRQCVAVCPDGICQQGETHSTCPQDCPEVSVGGACGNCVCEPSELYVEFPDPTPKTTCPEDCGFIDDGICFETTLDNCHTSPADCPCAGGLTCQQPPGGGIWTCLPPDDPEVCQSDRGEMCGNAPECCQVIGCGTDDFCDIVNGEDCTLCPECACLAGDDCVPNPAPCDFPPCVPLNICVPGPSCPNTHCEPEKGEDCHNCPDCACNPDTEYCEPLGTQCVTRPWCGDGDCQGRDFGEDCIVCEEDCPCGEDEYCGTLDSCHPETGCPDDFQCLPEIRPCEIPCPPDSCGLQDDGCGGQKWCGVCPPECGDGNCDGPAWNEDCDSCEQDCGCPSGRICELHTEPCTPEGYCPPDQWECAPSCVPRCPQGSCGWQPDGCGSTIWCGDCGPSCGDLGGTLCDTSPPCPPGYDNLGETYDCPACCRCRPRTCLPGSCGVLSDNCGGTIDCGPCLQTCTQMGGDLCGSGGSCPPGYTSLGPSSDCNPCCETCVPDPDPCGGACGLWLDNGCGELVWCGECPP